MVGYSLFSRKHPMIDPTLVTDPKSVATRVNSPNVDILPGYSLTGWSLIDYGIIEREVSKQYLRTIADSVTGDSSPNAVSMLRMAMEDVKRGNTRYGSLAFEDFVLSTSSIPFLLWIGLKKFQPTISQDHAFKLLTDDNQMEVYKAILTLNGYNLNSQPAENRPAALNPKSFDWDYVIRALRKLGHTIEKIAELTLPQVLFELQDYREGKDTSFSEKIQDSRFRLMDAILVKYKINKLELATMSLDEVKLRLASIEPSVVEIINDQVLADTITAYVANKD